MNIIRVDSQTFNQQPQVYNLLDLQLPPPTADTDIHTFIQFKQWINSPSFQIKTLVHNTSHIKRGQSMFRSLKVRPSKSLHQEHNQLLLGPLKRKQSFHLAGLDQIQEGGLGMQSSFRGGSSHISRSRKSSFNQDLGFGDDDILGNRSAHSSRSVNGYEQINQYELRQVIGKGSFATVYMGIDIQSEQKKKYAIKVLSNKHIKKRFLLKKNSQMIDSNHQEDQQGKEAEGSKPKESLANLFIRNEVAILKKMNHQYITKLYQVIVDNQKGKVYLVLEYCQGGFINQDKSKHQPYRKLLQSQCKRYCRQIGLALDYIHNVAAIAHRDIKPQNILLSAQDQVKISDFGLGTHKMKAKKQSGTPLFMPPQSQSQDMEICSKLGDIWAFGVTLLVMLKGKLPDFSGQKIQLQKEIASLKDVSDTCKDFISKCMKTDPKQRMNCKEILKHDWLKISGQEHENQEHVEVLKVTQQQQQTVFKIKQNNQSEIKIKIE